MIDQSHRELHRYIEQRAGDAYRTGFRYTSDDWEAMYVRDDVPTVKLKREVSEIIERARESPPLIKQNDYSALGEIEATTEVHEAGVILHFHEGPNDGTVVTLDDAASRQLSEFLTECTRRLDPHPTGAGESAVTPD